MASDVFFSDQSCYINDINRYHAVCYGLSNATKIFEKTFLFQYRFPLEQETKSVRAALDAGKHITDPDFPQFPYKIAFLNEWLIDSFLIGTFFELVAKAFLLDKGFVVHLLEKKSKDKTLRVWLIINTKYLSRLLSCYSMTIFKITKTMDAMD